MNLSTLSLGALVDRALEQLQSPAELGRSIVRPDALGAGDQALTVTDATKVTETDILEFGDELMFVTAKSDVTATATLSVIRGYYGTVAQGHDANDVGIVNPRWSRRRVANTVRESFSFIEANGLPLVFTEPDVASFEDPFDPRSLILPVPDGARRIYTVRYGTREVPNWMMIDNLSPSDYPAERCVRLPRVLNREDWMYSIVYQMPYRWYADDTFTTAVLTPIESSVIHIPEGADLLPPLYAAWRMASDRELSRNQIDRSEEFQQGQRDTGPTLVRLKREEFYAALDAARRLAPRPFVRPFISRSTYTGLRSVEGARYGN